MCACLKISFPSVAAFLFSLQRWHQAFGCWRLTQDACHAASGGSLLIMAYSVKDGDLGTGGPHPSLALGFSHTTKEAQNLFASIDTSETYAGWHACCFYPASFELLGPEARAAGRDRLVHGARDPKCGPRIRGRVELRCPLSTRRPFDGRST